MSDAIRERASPGRNASVKVAYARVITAHATELAADTGSGQVISRMIGRIQAGSTEVIAVRIGSCPDYLFLLNNVPVPALLRIGLTGLRSEVIALAIDHRDASDAITLRDPTTNLFMCAVSPKAQSGSCRLEGNRSVVGAWELFTLAELDPDAVTPAARSIATATARLWEAGHDGSSVLSYLRTADIEYARFAVNSTVPFLTTRELDRIVDATLDDASLYQRMQSIYQGDIWVDHIIPASPQAQAGTPVSHLRIGPEFDSLSDHGADGAFVSLPHAIATLARRRRVPGRRFCILATARNEGIYLLDWIAYHRVTGVEHFFIYSNDNDDGSDTLLSALAGHGLITWVQSEVGQGVSPQRKAYGHALSVLPEILDFDWCAIIDLDEFLALNCERFADISTYLRWQETRAVDGIALNWKFMASEESGSVHDEPLIVRNRRFVCQGAVGEGWRLVKSLCRPRQVMHANAHSPVASRNFPFVYRLSNGELHRWTNPPPGMSPDPGFSDTVNTDNLAIHHYFHKSAAEWLWKSSRARGDNTSRQARSIQPVSRNAVDNFMLQITTPSTGIDTRIHANVAAVRLESARLRQLPGIAEAMDHVRDSYASRMALIRQSAMQDIEHRKLTDHEEAFYRLLGLVGDPPAEFPAGA